MGEDESPSCIEGLGQVDCDTNEQDSDQNVLSSYVIVHFKEPLCLQDKGNPIIPTQPFACQLCGPAIVKLMAISCSIKECTIDSVILRCPGSRFHISARISSLDENPAGMTESS